LLKTGGALCSSGTLNRWENHNNHIIWDARYQHHWSGTRSVWLNNIRGTAHELLQSSSDQFVCLASSSPFRSEWVLTNRGHLYQHHHSSSWSHGLMRGKGHFFQMPFFPYKIALPGNKQPEKKVMNPFQMNNLNKGGKSVR
jgi:hypothetical protein